MMLTRSRTRSLAKEDDDKLAKKEFGIPERLYIYVNLALEAEQKLKTCPNDEGLLQQLSYDKEQIGIVAEFYKDAGHLPSDWEYHPDTASSYVPIKCPLVPAEKNIPRNPRMDSAILGGEPAKAARLNFKKLDKKLKKADKVAEKRCASSQNDYQKIDRVTPSKDSCIIQTRSRSSLARETDDKLAKKGSASSQSDYQKIDRVTQSKAPMMEQKLEIPETLYECINLFLEAEEKLKTCPNDEGWLKELNYAKGRIGSLSDFYKQFGQLQSDWKYDPDIASSYVPKSYVPKSYVPKKKPKKNIPRNPHIDSAPLVDEPVKAKAGQRNYKKLDEKAYTLSKNHSASSQIDNQKIDRSKEAPELEIPDMVYLYVKLALDAEQKLKTLPNDKDLLRKLSKFEEDIDSFANIYKARGQLLFDWKYDRGAASSYVLKSCPLVSAKKKIEMDIPPNPHINSASLEGKRAKAVWQTFKKLDKTFKKPTHLGLPCPADENIFTRLATDHKFVTFIRDFAVRVFNESCQMYRDNNNNNKNIINAEVQECKYVKVQPCYIFYMDIEAVEQGKSGTYEINLRCNLDDGAIVLDSFCLKGPEPLGTREGGFISLESVYETVKDDSLTDPEVYYYKSGMVRRTGGYDFYNPNGWDRLWEWDDEYDEESDDESDVDDDF